MLKFQLKFQLSTKLKMISAYIVQKKQKTKNKQVKR